ncbi:hypothetical protein DXG01_014883 [Tephrocybe rancida]|nr:hypothetical protein DXG01_014883 [Tephrocybe rancida]
MAEYPSTLSLQSQAKLSDGNEIPILGFGTYEMDGDEAYEGVTWALEAGYRHVDSAAWYENEAAVGRAILDFLAKHALPRSAVFYTTKLKLNAGFAAALAAIRASVDACGLGYVDLYLVHGPLGGSQMRKESWRACVQAKKEGLVRSIGISTFGVRHMKEILEMGTEVPAVHQIDLHPFMGRHEIVRLSREHGMLLEAWAPLVRGLRFEHPVIAALAKKYSKEPAQVLLRYSLQKGYVPLPKSASHKRIVSNAQIFNFALESGEVETLDALDEALVTDWDPTECGLLEWYTLAEPEKDAVMIHLSLSIASFSSLEYLDVETKQNHYTPVGLEETSDPIMKSREGLTITIKLSLSCKMPPPEGLQIPQITIIDETAPSDDPSSPVPTQASLLSPLLSPLSPTFASAATSLSGSEDYLSPPSPTLSTRSSIHPVHFTTSADLRVNDPEHIYGHSRTPSSASSITIPGAVHYTSSSKSVHLAHHRVDSTATSSTSDHSLKKWKGGEDSENDHSTAYQIEHEQDQGFDPSPFSFLPYELAHLINPPHSLDAMTRFGSTQALLDGLGTHAKKGLSQEALAIDAGAVANQSTQHRERSCARDGSPSMDAVKAHNRPVPESIQGVFSASIGERKRVYGPNILPLRSSKSLASLMRFAFKDKVLVLMSIAAFISLALRLFQDYGTPFPEGEPPTDWVEGLAIMVAIAIVVVVGSLNDWQKERHFKRLNDKKEDRGVKVIRNGIECMINIKDVVVGDIALLEPGEIVPCDGVFISGHNVQCDESSATGETGVMSKSSYEDCINLVVQDHEPNVNCYLVSGSKVLEGIGRYVVIAVGTKSFRGRIMMALQPDPKTTPLQRKLNSVAEVIAKFGSIAGLLLFITLMIRFFVQLGQDMPARTATQKGIYFVNILILSVALVVVAVPEGLPLAVTLALAFATKRMAFENLLVRVVGSCESLSSASVICTDKTGILTQNAMTVVAGSIGVRAKFVRQLRKNQSLHNADTGNTVTSTSPQYAARNRQGLDQKDFPIDQAHLNDVMPHALQDLFNEAIAVNSTVFEHRDPDTDEPVFVGSQTETALLQFAKEMGWGGFKETRENASVVERLPFSSERMVTAVVVQLPHSRKHRMYLNGAPELLYKDCGTHVVVHSPSPRRGRREANSVETRSIGSVELENITSTTDFYAKKSLRPIALCYKEFEEWPPTGTHLAITDLAKDLTLIGIVAIANPLREGVRDAVLKCRRAGVVVKMCTGDNLLTAQSIATQSGILESGGMSLEGSQFRRLDRDERRDAAQKLQVLARCSPSDKELLVCTLKDLGQVVAAIGNGPVLGEANIGFSKGITGTEVAKDSSDIILMDDNFSSIVKAIMWGRCIFDAVRKFLQFQTATGIAAVVITFVSAAAGTEEASVLSVVQLLWVNIIMDTFAALALATDSAEESLLARRPYEETAPLFTVDMYKQILILATYQIAALLLFHFLGHKILGLELTGNGLADNHTRLTVQTLVFNAFVFTQIFNSVNCRRLDKKLNVFEGIVANKYFLAILLLEIGVQTLIVFVAKDSFQVTKIEGREWGISLALGIAPIPLGALIRLLPNGPFEKLLVKLGLFGGLNSEVLPTTNRKGTFSTNAALNSTEDDLGTFKTVRGARVRSASFV